MSKDFQDYILNCVPSEGTETDWQLADTFDDGEDGVEDVPASIDLRQDWWPADDQGKTGACVGYAAAFGLLRWHYVKAGLLDQETKPSARFIWMANKETDNLTQFPTTFLEASGTQTKLALSVARIYGCVPESVLPMVGPRSLMPQRRFYRIASRLRIAYYINLGRNLDNWRFWLANRGPILTRLGVDRTWDKATENGGKLDVYRPETVRGGHAVCLVGYDKKGFIVRNSWGRGWGNTGFAHASNKYAQEAFTEAYGAYL